jgi:arabinofuranosyltransferase
LFRTAWVCDDAYITFRTIDNFVHGFGLRWNVDERVQAFTHPLWLLVLTPFYAVTREAWLTSMLLSIGISLATAAVVALRIARTWWTGAVAVAALLLAKSFVDFSTSGLENPLSHLLLALFVAWWMRGTQIRSLSLCAGLLAVNRLDLALLVAPAFVATLVRAPRREGGVAVAIAAAPLVAWECFSIVYYGFPFPNTAYAKLSTGVASGVLVRHGWLYVADSISRDPITLAIVACVPIAAAFNRRLWPGAIGLAAYLLYVARIGGDFMTGRFFSSPFVFAVAILASTPALATPWRAATALAALAALGTLPGSPTILSDGYYSAQAIPASGIANERGIYFRETGLLRKRHEWQTPRIPLQERYVAAIERGRHAIVTDFIGLQGFMVGPRLHIVDRLALTDPLLSRLPCEPGWRIGHFERALPDGYFESVERQTNAIVDPNLARYYERIVEITRGPIWSGSRWAAILRMNIGGYDGWVRAYVAARASASASARSERTKIHAAAAPSGKALAARTGFVGWMSPRNSSDTVTAVGTAATTRSSRVSRGATVSAPNHAARAPIAPDRYNPRHRPQTGS